MLCCVAKCDKAKANPKRINDYLVMELRERSLYIADLLAYM